MLISNYEALVKMAMVVEMEQDSMIAHTMRTWRMSSLSKIANKQEKI